MIGWLVDELHSKYYVHREIGRNWVRNDELLLLLDGLDEVRQDFREKCVEAINEFRHEHGLTALAICSRAEDYDNLSARLELQSAIYLLPLTPQQVEDFLIAAGMKLAGVRAALQYDVTLQELVKSPLMLSVMSLAYEGKSVQDLGTFELVDERRRHLFDTYVDTMFNRVARTTNELYPSVIT